MSDITFDRDAACAAIVHHDDHFVIGEWWYSGYGGPDGAWRHPGCDGTHSLAEAIAHVLDRQADQPLLDDTDPEAASTAIAGLAPFVYAELAALEVLRTDAAETLGRIAEGPPQRNHEEDATNILRDSSWMLTDLHGALYPYRQALPQLLVTDLDEATAAAHHANHLLDEALFPFASSTTTGRNDPCPCGSGKKYKYCHARK